MMFEQPQGQQGDKEESLEEQLRKMNAGSDIANEIIDTSNESNFELEGYDESKTVTAIAEQQLLKDEEISNYMQDAEYATIVNGVVAEMTTSSEKMRTFQEGLNATDAKEEYVEQATKKLTSDMKEEIQKRIMKSVAQTGKGNA